MKRTRPSVMIVGGIAGLVCAFLIESALTRSGRPVLVPPVTLTVTLVAIAILIVWMAWPIRRAVRGRATARVDPFRAARTAALAKACAVAGALLAGACIGVVGYLLTRTVVVAGGSLWQAVAAALGAIALLVAGLIAEHFCALPPPRDGGQGDPDSGQPV